MKPQYIIPLTLFLTACAPLTYNKPGVTQEAFSRDMLTCRQAAVQEAMLAGLHGNPFVEITVQSGIQRCMDSLGYSVTRGE